MTTCSFFSESYKVPVKEGSRRIIIIIIIIIIVVVVVVVVVCLDQLYNCDSDQLEREYTPCFKTQLIK